MEIELKKELKNCDFAKVILMIIIIFYHSILFFSGSWFTVEKVVYFNKIFQNVAKWLNSFHIHTFVLVSGYIYYYIRYEKNDYQDFKKFALNKFKRLVIPYICVFFLWALPVNLCFFEYNMQMILDEFVFGVSQLWFLLMLFWVFIIAYLSSDFIKKYTISVLIISILLYFCGWFVVNIFQIQNALKFLIFFIIGFKIRQFKIIIHKWYILLLLPLHILFFSFDLDFSDVSVYYIMKFIGRNCILNIVGSLMCFYCLQYIASKFNYDNCIFRFFRKRSMIVYLLNEQIIYFLVVMFNGVFYSYAHAFINFFVSVVISLIIASVLLKFKVTRVLFGEK